MTSQARTDSGSNTAYCGRGRSRRSLLTIGGLTQWRVLSKLSPQPTFCVLQKGHTHIRTCDDKHIAYSTIQNLLNICFGLLLLPQ